MTRPVRPEELGNPGEGTDSSELAAAYEAARLLERELSAEGVQPSPDFATRVMAAVATQPTPRRSRLAVLAGAVGAAWRTALAANQPPIVRARAIAVVLVVVLALGSLGGAATLAAASALNLIGPQPTPSPLMSPAPTPSPSAPPSTGPKPGLTPEPTELETPEPGETPGPGETAEPGASDDHGGGGGGDGGSATPRPTRTPRATETPKPTDIAEPTETPDASDH